MAPTRIAVVNEEIYRITEAKYQKLHRGLNRGEKVVVRAPFESNANAEADFIRKHGKKILDADIMVRDD